MFSKVSRHSRCSDESLAIIEYFSTFHEAPTGKAYRGATWEDSSWCWETDRRWAAPLTSSEATDIGMTHSAPLCPRSEPVKTWNRIHQNQREMRSTWRQCGPRRIHELTTFSVPTVSTLQIWPWAWGEDWLNHWRKFVHAICVFEAVLAYLPRFLESSSLHRQKCTFSFGAFDAWRFLKPFFFNYLQLFRQAVPVCRSCIPAPYCLQSRFQHVDNPFCWSSCYCSTHCGACRVTCCHSPTSKQPIFFTFVSCYWVSHTFIACLVLPLPAATIFSCCNSWPKYGIPIRLYSWSQCFEYQGEIMWNFNIETTSIDSIVCIYIYSPLAVWFSREMLDTISRIVFAFVCDLLEVWTFDNARHRTQGACADTVWRFWVWRCSMSATEGQQRPSACIGLSCMLWCAPQDGWKMLDGKACKNAEKFDLSRCLGTHERQRGERGVGIASSFLAWGRHNAMLQQVLPSISVLGQTLSSQTANRCIWQRTLLAFRHWQHITLVQHLGKWSLERWQQISTWSSFLMKMHEYG